VKHAYNVVLIVSTKRMRTKLYLTFFHQAAFT